MQNRIETFLEKDGVGDLGEDVERHLQSCSACRRRYMDRLREHHGPEWLLSPTGEVKGAAPSAANLADPFPDVSGPIEYKDASVRFTLHLDGREEEIKVVEPKVDFPLPAGARLIVSEEDRCLADVVFEFKPENERPYELHFGAPAGPQVRKYGKPETEDHGFNNAYTEKLVESSGLKSWIEMRRGTARIYIRYHGE
jgi:hypothetical protein